MGNLEELVKSANGRRRNRIITAQDIARFREIFEANKDDPEIKTIRVYPANDPFVANSYDYRAEVTCIVAERSGPNGEWIITAKTVDAHRSHGSSAKVTINGRAA